MHQGTLTSGNGPYGERAPNGGTGQTFPQHLSQPAASTPGGPLSRVRADHVRSGTTVAAAVTAPGGGGPSRAPSVSVLAGSEGVRTPDGAAQPPLSEKCWKSLAPDQMPPHPQPTFAKALTTRSPGLITPGASSGRVPNLRAFLCASEPSADT
jgi:hypothetical protein